jgi:IS605 OrfB family transposase
MIASAAQTGLTAQVAISAIRDACAAYRTLRTQKKRPEKPVHFAGTSATLQGGERGRDFAFRKSGVSISTSAGRFKQIAYHHAPEHARYFDGTWTMGTAKLTVRRGKVYLLVAFSKSIPEPASPVDGAVGVDRGQNYLAVATSETASRFFGGSRVKQARYQYRARRRVLQRKKAQTHSRSVRRVLQRLSGRESRFVCDVNHVISKRLVQFALSVGHPAIALEDLKGIRGNGRRQRKSQRADFHSWSFLDLEQKLVYKAQAADLEVVRVDPHYTSQTCSRCGYTDRANRTRHDFTCRACGYRLHADLNASRNVRLRGILARQVPRQDGAPSVAPGVPPVDAKAPSTANCGREQGQAPAFRQE